jgi:hypothetical protein
MIQFRTRVFQTTRRLARIHTVHERFLHHGPACGGDVPESIEHIMLECPRWEWHRRNFGMLGARRRRSGGGPGGGCAHMPVGTYLYLHAVGDGYPVAVPGLAR